jgi:hypothetical protein
MMDIDVTDAAPRDGIHKLLDEAGVDLPQLCYLALCYCHDISIDLTEVVGGDEKDPDKRNLAGRLDSTVRILQKLQTQFWLAEYIGAGRAGTIPESAVNIPPPSPRIAVKASRSN